MELFALSFLLKSNKVQCPTYDMNFTQKKGRAVNIKDVEWLTVKLADNSEEISSIKHELKQLKMNKNMHNNKHILIPQNLLMLKQKQRLFKIPPEQHEVSVTITPTCLCDIKEFFKCQMTMFHVNINTSSTRHKLQGRSKDMVIVSSWTKLKAISVLGIGNI
jgi:hypothetical protein